MIKIDKKTILTKKTEDLTKLNYNELNNLSKEELQTLVKELARRSERRRSRVEKSKEFESIKDVFAYKDWSEKKVEQKQKRVKFDYGDFTGYSNLKFEYNVDILIHHVFVHPNIYLMNLKLLLLEVTLLICLLVW